jgi:choline dehydrogenase-like flavoprotein
MIDDFEAMESGFRLETDICVVGTGAAGLALIQEFAGTRIQIIAVESGGSAPGGPAMELNDGEVAGLPFAGLRDGRARAFGGTSNLWGGQCIQLDPIDFEQRSWVPFSGWPLSRRELIPWYRRAMERLGIVPGEYEGEVWDRFGLDGVALDPALLRMVHTIFIAQHNLGRRCCSELEMAPNVRVLLNASLLDLEMDATDQRVSSARIGSLSGRRGLVSARAFVLCAGTLENARLLLLSGRADSTGIGNQGGNVGRFLQDHPVCRCAEIVTAAPRRLQDHFNLLYSPSARTLRHGKGKKYLPKIALSEDAQRRERSLNCIGQLDYEFSPGSAMHTLKDLVVALHMGRQPERLLATGLNVAAAAPLLARGAWRFAARGLTPATKPAHIYLNVISEQTPNPASRVTLGSRTDAFGLPQACVDWRLEGLDWHTFAVFARTVQAEFGRLGLGSVILSKWVADRDFAGAPVRDLFHPAGTTRMALSPSEGVVDTDCRVFGVEGLYVVGASVFPTSGTANPVLTITALALRLADHLKAGLLAGVGAFGRVPA